MLKKTKGQGLIEYLILVSLISVCSIAVVSLVGANVQELYANISNSLRSSNTRVNMTEVKDRDYKRRWMDDFTEGARRQ